MQGILKLLQACRQQCPTDDANHNVTLTQSNELSLNVYAGKSWHSFTLLEYDFDDDASMARAVAGMAESIQGMEEMGFGTQRS